MIRWPIEFPWQVVGALVVTILCFLGVVFLLLSHVGRTLRERRRGLERGDVPTVREWGSYPNEFERDWWSR